MEYIYSNGELYHHGVKGMKWGVRRYRNADGSLTAAGRARLKKTTYGSTKTKAETKSDRDHSESDKSPLIKLAADIALDIIFLNPISATMDAARLVQAGKAHVQTSIYNKDRKDCKTDKSTGFLIKNRSHDRKQDANRVNPMFHNFDNNTKNNCMLCTSAYDLRRRGYEVRAKKASYGYLTQDVKAWYPKAKINTVSGVDQKGRPSNKAMISNLKNELVKQGNGARGNLMVTWKNMKGGHSVAYEILNGQLCIVDAQIGKLYNNVDSLLKRCEPTVEYARLDNVKFSTKNIKEVAE